MSSYAVKLYCFMKKLLKIHWSFLWFNNDDIPGMSYIRFFTMLNLQQLKDWTIINQLNHLLCIITCNNTCIINTCMLMTFRKSWLKFLHFFGACINIHKNSVLGFFRILHPTLGVHIINGCVLYMRLFGKLD